ncbi:MAG: ABC transporter permease subunit [Verrucomicrobia bacterium]|nr:ABC transporter permease subunit [Verrucomicrobiota bacterium]
MATVTFEAASSSAKLQGSSLWRDAWFRLRKNVLAIVGLCTFCFITAACLIGPFFTGYSYERTELSLKASPPLDKIIERTERRRNAGPKITHLALSSLENEFLNRPAPERKSIIREIGNRRIYIEGQNSFQVSHDRHWFGTDPLGRDLLTRVLIGGRISLTVGFAATLVSTIIGVFWGSVAGFVGGKVDSLMMRFADILYALPFTVIVILLMMLFGRNFLLLFVAIGAVEWLNMSRIVRGEIISLKQREFIEAAISLGLSNRRILVRHLIPNVMSSIIIFTTLTVPNVIMLESVLSFLGLGVQPPLSSWGVLIDEGARTMDTSIWLLAFPALAFSLTLFSLNFLGDGLRDALDPKASRD